MKKLTIALATTGVVLFGGTFASSVSAAEHEVSQGETLWQIAEENDTSVDQIMDVNALDSHIIHPGQIIETEEENKEALYTVQKGDTLSEIAINHDMTVKELKSNNDLSSSLIIVGDKLKVDITEDEATEEVAETPEENTEEADPEPEENNQADETAASETEKNEAVDESAEAETSSEQPSGESMTMTATAYTAECDGCSGVTATGIDLANNPDKKVIAVDPDVIPLGSTVYVEGYGEAIAGDTGGAIKGDKIDIHVPTKADASSWGVQTVNMTVLD